MTFKFEPLDFSDISIPSPPKIQDYEAEGRFREKIRCVLGGDPDSVWNGGYVSHVWQQCRYPLAHYLRLSRAKRVLEFGCNIGATSVVLAHLGVEVEAIDVNPLYIDIARDNALRHGLTTGINFVYTPETTKLPWADESFDFITCNSVLEYIPYEDLATILAELARVLSPGGILFIAGTSNRLSLIEIHSRRWFINYLPRSFGPADEDVERGLFPWEVVGSFPGYTQLDKEDKSRTYFQWKASSGLSKKRRAALRIIDTFSRRLGFPVALLTPSFSTALQKPVTRY